MRASMSWDGTKKRFVKRVAAVAMVIAVLAPSAAFAKPPLTSTSDGGTYSTAMGSSWS